MIWSKCVTHHSLSCSLLLSPLPCVLCVVWGVRCAFDFWFLTSTSGIFSEICISVWESISIRSDLESTKRIVFFSQNPTQWLSSRITEWGLWSLTNMLGRKRQVIFLWDGEVLPTVADCDWRPQLLLTSFVRILRARKCYGKAITGREEKSSVAKLPIYNGNGLDMIALS